eukprot:CAMPEP_0171206686 /NCGR_PEP_ID=MMETSP0790-20130122/27189_1 /TAXON_ID=2925 /ORGANISM="Alexandrium catenella, Strain OF101" /LENGTH=137 /DNA_ID=CAMNT_0011672235 /DNA_START=39 /DNA_END=452 /DNA_ORIENTATION=-
MSGPLLGVDCGVARFVTVQLGTKKNSVEESVYVDPVKGPLLYVQDGTTTFLKWRPERFGKMRYFRSAVIKQTWPDYSSTEKDYMLYMVAKRNMRNREEAEAGRAKMPDLAPWEQAAAEAADAKQHALEYGGEGIERE